MLGELRSINLNAQTQTWHDLRALGEEQMVVGSFLSLLFLLRASTLLLFPIDIASTSLGCRDLFWCSFIRNGSRILRNRVYSRCQQCLY